MADRVCGHCDNRHGCRTPPPPCLCAQRAPADAALSGREWVRLHQRTDLCERCGFFRWCWTGDAWRAVRKPAVRD